MFEILNSIPIGQWALIMVIMIALILLIIVVRRGTLSSESIESNHSSARVMPPMNLGTLPAEWTECPEGQIVEFNEVDDEILFRLAGDERIFWVPEDDPLALELGECFDTGESILLIYWEVNPDGRVRVFEATVLRDSLTIQ